MAEIDKNDMAKIDPNFSTKDTASKDGMIFYNADEKPFRIYGVFRDGDRYRRIPTGLAESISENTVKLHANTAGGRVRFETTSSKIVVRGELGRVGRMAHFALTGSTGFDVYYEDNGRQRYLGTVVPPFGIQPDETIEKTLVLPADGKSRLITVEMPLYSDVKNLWIGLEDGASLTRAKDYRIEKPVVSYGSSITQGGCASKPGSSYQAILSHKLDCNYINLGFSGNAKGDPAMAEYIAGLDMSVFLLDYDHNAPTVEHLAATHENFFKTVRNKNPDLPILMMGRPKHFLTDDEKKRLDVIRTTYQNAVDAGDRNVYLLTGPELMSDLVSDNGTVDNAHPTDSGFLSMAMALEPLLTKLLG